MLSNKNRSMATWDFAALGAHIAYISALAARPFGAFASRGAGVWTRRSASVGWARRLGPVGRARVMQDSERDDEEAGYLSVCV